jgi:serine/alanine adding enzyme
MNGLLEVDPAAWNELLEQLGCADVYLLREYVESACLLERGRPVFLRFEENGADVVFPLLVRDLPGGEGLDATTPYGYGGPVAPGMDPPRERFWSRYQAWCETNGIVTTFIRFHPLFDNLRLASPPVHPELLAGTVGWRLDLPDLFAAMYGAHRTSCRKAERAGVVVDVTVCPPDLSPFVALYEATLRRLEADDFYRFPADYWSFLAERLRQWIVLFDAHESSEVVASALCFATPPWLHYHLAATAERGRALGASNLLLYEAARWARGRGFERFHLGGGVGGREDSLLSFKRRFDPGGLLECAVGKIVHDAARYRALSGRDADDVAGFFPAYRTAA